MEINSVVGVAAYVVLEPRLGLRLALKSGVGWDVGYPREAIESLRQRSQ